MDGTNGVKENTRVTAPVASSTLSVNVFTAPGKAMVGERVLVDAMTTVAEAEALADWIAPHNRKDFDRVKKTATSDQDLFDQMTALYPDWVANQSWLMFGFPGV
jgi:hypothetical protein